MPAATITLRPSARPHSLVPQQRRFVEVQQRTGHPPTRRAQSYSDKSRGESALASIAKAQAEAGRFAQAIGLAKSIEQQGWRINALLGIARAQAEAGLIREATELAQLYSDGIAFFGANIAAAQFKAGMAKEAAATLDQMRRFAQSSDDGFFRSRVLADIAMVQAKAAMAKEAAATLDEAAQVAQSIKDSPEAAVAYVAEAQAEVGRIPEALQLLQSVSGLQRDLSLMSVVKAQAKAGHIAEARQLTQSINNEITRSWALAEIAVAQAEAGQFAEAIQLALSNTDAFLRASTLARMAGALPK